MQVTYYLPIVFYLPFINQSECCLDRQLVTCSIDSFISQNLLNQESQIMFNILIHEIIKYVYDESFWT